MAMQVTENRNPSRLWLTQRHIVFQEINLRVHDRIGVRPPPVKIKPCEWTPRISDDHSIRVDHWHKFDNILLEKFIVLVVIFSEFKHNISHYEWPVCLRGMQPSLDVNELFSFVLHWNFLAFCDRNLVNIETTDRLAQNLLAVVDLFIENVEILVPYLIAPDNLIWI